MIYRLIRTLVLFALTALLALLAGCSPQSDAPKPTQVSSAPNSAPMPLSPAQPGLTGSPSADISTLQSQRKRDEQTLNDANKAVNVLGNLPH